jgi:hypothetical protein
VPPRRAAPSGTRDIELRCRAVKKTLPMFREKSFVLIRRAMLVPRNAMHWSLGGGDSSAHGRAAPPPVPYGRCTAEPMRRHFPVVRIRGYVVPSVKSKLAGIVPRPDSPVRFVPTT